MNDDVRLDDELAAYTDRVLGGDPDAPPDAAPDDLGPVVQRLYWLVDPDQPPDAAFQQRLAQRLEREWVTTRQRRSRRGAQWANRTFQLATLAAALVVVVAAALLLSMNGDGETLQGASSGSLAGIGLVVVLLVALAGAVWYLRDRS